MNELLEKKIEEVVERIDTLIQSREDCKDSRTDNSKVIPPHVRKQELKQALLVLIKEIWR